MAIYTRLGCKVTIIKGSRVSPDVTVAFRKEDGGGTMETYLSELKADGGFDEIMDTIQNLNTRGG